MSTSAEITKKAKSNFAFTLCCVPKERRKALTSYYAFCRVIDDITDDLELPVSEKKENLTRWKTVIETSTPDDTLPLPDLQQELLQIRDTYHIPNQHLTPLIDGCLSDLTPQRFGTWEDLSRYTYQVASSVGLCCLPLFGADPDRAQEYAINLGHALQLTNILRDIREDLDNGVRIYLPLNDLARFTYTERDLIGRVHDSRFLAFMNHQAERAYQFYQKATDTLPPEDHKALLAPRLMHRIYHTLLKKMQADQFQVFQKRYRHSKPKKLLLLTQELCSK